jgi:acetyl coenzyme A synthetase (ADP forming)-like protein
MARGPLDPLLRPRTVAVIGASRRRGTIAGEIFHNLLASGFTGTVYPVNPTAPAVQGVRAYASIEDVPEAVDLAIVAVPAAQVVPAARACVARGVRALVVISAGFAETGPAGAARQAELVELVRAHGVRMVGPNCLGLLNTAADVRLDATFAPTFPPPGGVAFSSQSGALGLAILDLARDLGIGVSQFVSVGNKADVSGNDLLEHWEHDDDTRVILLYLESLGNPRRFLQIARRVARKKPIVAVKSGRSEAGARAASSHTGALAGADAAIDALMRQAGVIRVDSAEQLFDAAMLLAHQPVPRGKRVAILTNAGGPGIMAADACEGRGLELPALAPGTMDALRARLPPEASVRNPVDMIATASADAYEACLRALLADPAVDAALVLFVPPIVTEATDVAAAIRRAAGDAGARTGKPVLTCFMGTHGVPPALSSLREGAIPSYRFPEAAAAALAHAVRYGRWLARPEGVVVEPRGFDVARARAAVAGAAPGEWLAPERVRELCAAMGLHTPWSQACRDAETAAALAGDRGGAVAVKLISPTITHKSDVGGVALGLVGRDAVLEACRAMRARLATLGRERELEGFLVQEMAPAGIETFVGLAEDPGAGRLVAFGAGGVAVEVWRDVALRVCPLTDVDARELVAEPRVARLLAGFRGRPPGDVDAVLDALARVSALAEVVPEITEMDINPLVARAPGEGVVAVDARVRIRGAAAATTATPTAATAPATAPATTRRTS